MAEQVLAGILEQCKANDVESRIDALGKLERELEMTGELSLTDILVPTLKACLRTSNVHLSSAAVSVIHTVLSIVESQSSAMMDLPLLRQLVLALMPAGGVIDRLGEQREKVRDNSREILVKLGAMCLNASPISATKSKEPLKGVETPLLQFERFLREVGLGSKVWRVREQAILVVADIRRLHPTFPLRPFLPSLVQMVQDSDGTVRECARKSVIEIFAAPSVTDAARADLKKEMEKQGVRKNVTEEILASVIGKHEPAAALEPTAALRQSKMERLPSVAPPVDSMLISKDLESQPRQPNEGEQSRTTSDIQPVYIASSRDLENEFSKMLIFFQGKETEHNWSNRERSVERLRGMIKGDVHRRYGDVFFFGLKSGLMEATFKALLSLRTSVAICTISWYIDFILAVGQSADPFVDSLLTQLLRMAGYTKKLVATQSQMAVTAILQHTTCPPRTVIPLLWNSLQEKIVQARQFAMTHVKTFLDAHGRKSKHAIESSGSLEIIESCLKKGVGDPGPAVREASRSSFWAFYEIWEDRASNIFVKLDVTAKKQLERACPFPQLPSIIAQPMVEPKKTSVAAAIAASKAKSKQIAVAPPSLRHQATSASQISNNPPTKPLLATRRVTSPTTPPRSARAILPQPSPTSKATQQRRTPSTTTLPVSSDGSARGSPSPPPVRGAGIHTSRIPSPTPRTNHPMSGHQAHRSITNLGASHLRPTSPLSSPAFQQPFAHEMPLEQGGVPHSPVSSSPEHKQFSEASFNLMSFSSPPKPSGPDVPFNARNGSLHPDPAIEEELRATSAQAEAAAEQLLDLSLGADESPGLATPISSVRQESASSSPSLLPQTPLRNDDSRLWAEVQAFQNSPPQTRTPLQLSVLQDQRHHTSWWLKTKSRFDDLPGPSSGIPQQLEELDRCINALNHVEAEVSEISKLISICRAHPSAADVHVTLPASPTQATSDDPFWKQGESFERLLDALLQFLTLQENSSKAQAALALLWEMVESQLTRLHGHELRIYQMLFALRATRDKSILEATNAVRDALNAQIDPLYGLTTLHSCLNQTLRDVGSASNRAGSHVFGLNGIGKFVLRLPSEVLEEELPRLRSTILSSLANENSVVRSAASMVVVASQIVLGDQAHLFALLDGLSEEKKNFLTYMFDKNGVHAAETTAKSGASFRRVELEMDKLDDRLDPR